MAEWGAGPEAGRLLTDRPVAGWWLQPGLPCKEEAGWLGSLAP